MFFLLINKVYGKTMKAALLITLYIYIYIYVMRIYIIYTCILYTCIIRIYIYFSLSFSLSLSIYIYIDIDIYCNNYFIKQQCFVIDTGYFWCLNICKHNLQSYYKTSTQKKKQENLDSIKLSKRFFTEGKTFSDSMKVYL